MLLLKKKCIKCVSLSNEKCEIRPTLIILHLNEYHQELYYYPSAVKFNKFAANCNIFNDLSIKYKFLINWKI